MKSFVIFFAFIFIFSCTNIDNKKNLIQNKKEIDFTKEYSFDEYVDLLIKNNHSEYYSDINSLPE